MAQELLSGLEIDSAPAKHYRQAVAEGVPADSLCYSEFAQGWPDMPLEQRVRLQRLKTILRNGREEVILVAAVR